MEFHEFNNLFEKHFVQLTKDAPVLFEVALDKDELWNLYLDSFPAGYNEVYRTRREHDCSCCRHFVKAFGNVVVVKNGKVHTMWDFETGEDVFQPVINAMNQHVLNSPVLDVYFSKFNEIGSEITYDHSTDSNIIAWNHFHVLIPGKFVNNTSKSNGELKGEYRDTKNVFKRSLEEISEDSVRTVLELISQNSLYKGEEWKSQLESFLKYKKEYSKLQESEKENYCWEKSITVGGVIGRIKNHSIGTLLVGITEGGDLDVAVRKYEAIVAPTNYKRPKAIFTQKMLEEAKKTIESLGYGESLGRRYATIEDITVNNILFSNRDVAKKIKGSVFDEMSSGVAVNPKKFSKVDEISIEDFVSKVLPSAMELEVFLENKHANNFVSLIAPQSSDAKSMFKWDNAFSWAYSGNITDSMKERVKAAGGSVDGILRFSIQWNDGKQHDMNDLDAHCKEPNGDEIYYARRTGHQSGGSLDVDIIGPVEGIPAVENITWQTNRTMPEGKYLFFVHNFSHRGGKNGFSAEVEFDGQIFSFEYNKEVRYKEDIMVAEVTYSKSSGFTIKELLPSNVSSREVWNLNTNQFVPVSVVMFSPNYWDEQNGNGNRHYFFMLKDCINPESPNGFYNEFLKEDLMKHKRVFEALGGRMHVEETENQLSGLGFSSTKKNELLVRVKGQTDRVVKIKF